MNSPLKGSKDSGYNLTKDKYIFNKINFLSMFGYFWIFIHVWIICFLKGKQIRGNTNQTAFITLNQEI